MEWGTGNDPRFTKMGNVPRGTFPVLLKSPMLCLKRFLYYTCLISSFLKLTLANVVRGGMGCGLEVGLEKYFKHKQRGVSAVF